MTVLNRRNFMHTIGTAITATALTESPQDERTSKSRLAAVQPIKGTWFSLQYPDLRHKYSNPQMLRFTCRDFETKIREMAEFGMEYLVFNALTMYEKAFYPSRILPQWEFECVDPVETILTTADRYRMKLFMSCEYYWNEDDELNDPELMAFRMKVMEEVTDRYGTHPSFYGWYFAREAYLNPYFSADFMRYLNTLAAEARKLTPAAKILTAPCGTRFGAWDDTYIRQLEHLDADIIAYQDEVGCYRETADGEIVTPKHTAEIFAGARAVHDKAGHAALWADVETFTWERGTNDRQSALVPAPWPRLLAQLAAVSPWVDTILVYTYQGILDTPDSSAALGHRDAPNVHRCYTQFFQGGVETDLQLAFLNKTIQHDAVGKPVTCKQSPSGQRSSHVMTDGVLPEPDERDEAWYLIEGGEFEAVIDLGDTVPIQRLGAWFLHKKQQKIYLPHKVIFEISDDGVEFQRAALLYPETWMNDEYDAWAEVILSPPLHEKARFIRCRALHGYPAMYIGEIVVNPRPE